MSPADLAGPERARTVARILALPRVCPQLVQADEDTTPLLDRQAQVAAWIEQALPGPQTAAPAEIRVAYEELAACLPGRP